MNKHVYLNGCFVCSNSHVIFIVRNDDALFHIDCASLNFINVNGTKRNEKENEKSAIVAKWGITFEELGRMNVCTTNSARSMSSQAFVVNMYSVCVRLCKYNNDYDYIQI